MRQILFCCMLVLILCCKQRYDPDFVTPDRGYLVVDGTITRTGTTLIKLSRSIKLSDTARPKFETLAQVSVEGKDNSKFMLAESPGGRYTANLNLTAAQQYRLHVRTRDGKDYFSAWLDVKSTPDIDDIPWARENGNAQLYVKTHDPQNNTRYYRWEYDETWEFHSAYETTIQYNRHPVTGEVTGVRYRKGDETPDYTVYKCWQSEASSRIIIGTSAKLSQDVIHLPLLIIPGASWKLSVLYSVNVKQYAITKEEYDFLNKMKRNTEETGSLFDPQPSELKGNIYSATDANEPVIGFIGISELKEKRIFIYNSQVPGWNYRHGCSELDIPNKLDSLKAAAHLEPTTPSALGPGGSQDIQRIFVSAPSCVLCTLQGTNVKPLFWP